MRKFLIPLLLASALAPAAAIAEDGDSRRGTRAHAERGDRDRSDAKQSNDDRPQRSERSSESDRPAPVERSEQPVRVERADRPARIERTDRPARIERVQRINRDSAVVRRAERPVIQSDPNGEVRAVEPVQQTQTTQSSGSRFVDGIRDGIRDHDELERRDRDRDGHRWSGDWRRDHRYDWRSHRHRHGSLFRIGRYYDPYGWGYRRWSIGFSLWPSYYGSNYWLNDPWMYRLPPVYGPYRWVRYYDDALLVNIYTGEVVDVIHNFFW